MDYKIVAFEEEKHSRRELREYEDRWSAVYLKRLTPEMAAKRKTEWYIKETITILK